MVLIIGIALGLAMDAFAISLVIGSRLKILTFRPIFRLAFHFGLFQFLMPIVGWLVGQTVSAQIKEYDHWVAFGLLAIIGLKMIRESLAHKGEEKPFQDPTRKWSLVMLTLATSIDALAVGLSIAMLEIEVFFASAIIGLVTAGMTTAGMLSGRKLGAWLGRYMELAGGLILIAIGLKILIQHLRG
jgi:putative Mn2+ efflux pump MntP